MTKFTSICYKEKYICFFLNPNCISFMYDGMYEFSACILQVKNCREKDCVAIM